MKMVTWRGGGWLVVVLGGRCEAGGDYKGENMAKEEKNRAG